MSVMTDAKPMIKTTPPALAKAEPCVLVIFGATGDLTRRKLIPALFDLACEGCMPPSFRVLGIGRSAMADDAFRSSMGESLKAAKGKDFNPDQWNKFAQALFFFEGDPNDKAMYSRLSTKLTEMNAAGASPNNLFYFSVPPSVAPAIVAGLGKAGLAGNEKGWSRIIVEKPFGRDLTSARQLNSEIG